MHSHVLKTSSISVPVIIDTIASALVVRRACDCEGGGLDGETEPLRLVPGGMYQPWCQVPPLPPPHSLPATGSPNEVRAWCLAVRTLLYIKAAAKGRALIHEQSARAGPTGGAWGRGGAAK